MTTYNKISVYTRLLLLVIFSSGMFVLLFVSLFYYILKQEDQVYQNTRKQFKNEVNSLMKLNSESHISTIVDITYWDELVKFTASRNQKWFESSIGSAINMYQVEYIAIYDLRGTQIGYKRKATQDYSFTFINDTLLKYLYQKKIINFYVNTPHGIAEVFGATIHPSNDPTKTKSKPSGYFFMVRLLNTSYLKRLQDISSSKISFSKVDEYVPFYDDYVFNTYKLKSWDGQKAGVLLFKRPFYVNFNTTENILYIIFIFGIGVLILFLIFLKKWISHPLKLITRILETDNRKAIKELKLAPGEFSKIGRLFQDNSSQKKLLVKAKAKAEESDQLKSAFLTNLSHEIRTPMNAIIGFSELLSQSELKEDEKNEYLGIIHKSGHNLVSIIDDLIEMSRIDSNQVTPNLTSISFESCLEDIYQSIKITIPKDKNIAFLFIKPETQLPHAIFTDVVKLKQILTNLITNAIKFTHKGHVSMAYHWRKKKNQVEITIEDTGLGIEKVNQDFIFERFRRIDGDYSIKAGGLGLGLAITKAYVELLGGTITLKSDIGKGATFKVTLPLLFDKNIPSLEKKESTPEIVSVEKEQKILSLLIAEDDNINFLLFERIIKDKNYNIQRAKNGEEAIKLALKSDFDLILMDIKMPILSGYEALQKIKEIKPKSIIIAQTAFSSSDEIEKIMAAGFDGYITKPLERNKLFEIMNSFTLTDD